MFHNALSEVDILLRRITRDFFVYFAFQRTWWVEKMKIKFKLSPKNSKVSVFKEDDAVFLIWHIRLCK